MGGEPSNARGSILGEYQILDSAPEEEFDRLTALAADYTKATLSAIGLLDNDREWMKSTHGELEIAQETPLDQTFCRFLLEEDQLVVPDATQDPRFSSLPAVTGVPKVRSYAGVAVKAYDGRTVGSFCVLDTEARQYEEAELEILRTLARQVEALLELRRTRDKLNRLAPDAPPTYQELTRRLAMLYDHAASPFYMVDEDWRFVYMNAASAGFLGHTREELIGRKLWEDFPEAKTSTFRDRMFEVAETHQNQEFELFFEPLDTWFHVRLIYADPGVAVFYDDISDRILRMRQVTEDEERFRLLSEVTHDALFDWDPIAGRLSWSLGVEALLGYRPDELVDEEFAWQNLLHPDDLEPAQSTISAAFASGSDRWSVHSRWIRKDGRVIRVDVNGRLIRDRLGKVVRAVGGVSDETEQVIAAGRIQMLAALLDKARDAIMVYDLTGKIEFWNESAEELYGWKAAEARGQQVHELLYEDPGQFLAAQAELVTEREWDGELPQQNRDGESLDVKVNWSLVPDVNHTERILAIHTDVTHSKKLEMQLLRVERIKTIGRLAGGIAHDLNNILAPILATVSAHRGTTDNPELEEDLEMIETCVVRGAEMIRQLLEFARGASGTKVPTDILEILDDVRRMVAETFPKSIEFVIQAKRDLPAISAVPTQIHQVITNLLINARDAMPDGGVLEISFDEVAVESHGDGMEPGSFVQIRVRDSGMGIPEEEQERIFEPFYTTKEIGKGTGLGLSTVHRIVSDHGGILSVDSVEGRGTTFTVLLPVDEFEAPEAASTQSHEVTTDSSEHRILVVDDEEAIRRVATNILRRRGYDVLTATNGAEALQVLEESGRVDLVILDMAMPVMDGAHFILALQELGTQLVIIASTGFDFDQSAPPAVRSAIFDFLPKPYDMGQLLQAVQTGLTEARDRQS